MRVCYKPVEFHRNNDKLFMAALQSDPCAEHEWGIDDLKDKLGVPKVDQFSLEYLGMERHRITDQSSIIRQPFTVHEHPTDKRKKVTYAAIGCSYKDYNVQEVSRLVFCNSRMVSCRKEHGPYDAYASWCEKSFLVVFPKDLEREYNELCAAFDTNDVAITTNIGAFHTGGGLVLAIISNIPKGDIEKLIGMQQEEVKNQCWLRDSGIKEKLKAARKIWFSLDTIKNFPPDHKKPGLRVWLNPFDQKKYNYGWFTLEELEAWANDQGPIVK